MNKPQTLYLSDMPADIALNAQDHNYLRLLETQVLAGFLVPGIFAAHVAHENPCAIFAHGNCNCRPDIDIERLADQKIVFSLRWR